MVQTAEIPPTTRGVVARLERHRVIVELRHRATAAVILALVFLASAQLVLVPVFGASWQSIPGDAGDMRLVNYVLEHAHQYFSGRVADFWNAPFFFPHPNVLVLSENQVGAAPFYSLFRLTGFDRETSLQAWILTGFLLNYGAAAFVLRRIGFSLHLAALGACLFAFSVPQMLHLNHTQLTYRFPVPLAWYAAHRYLSVGRPRDLALCGLFTCWQFYITPYFGFFLSLALLVTAAAHAAAQGEAFTARWLGAGRRRWAADAGIAGACAALLLPVLVPYMAAEIPPNPIDEVLGMLPRPQSYLMGSRDDYLAKLLAAQWSVDDVAYPWEHLIFPGLAALLSAPLVWALLLVPRIRVLMPAAVRIAAVTLLVLVVLTLSVRDVSLYRVLLDLVPPVRGFRTVTRISLLFSFFAALCVCWLLSFAFSTFRGLRPLWVQVALAALVWGFSTWEAGVNVITLSKSDAQARVARIVSDVEPAATPDSVLVTLQTDPEEPSYYTQTASMLAAQELGLRTMNGHSRAVPPGFSVRLTQCGDVIPMARAYEQYVPGFRFEDVRGRILVSPAGVNCAATWDRLLRPPPAGGAAMPADYRASFEIRCLNCPIRVNEVAQFVVDVTNASARAWPLLPLRLSGRFVRAETNETVSGFETRVYLGQVLEAGGTAPLVLALKGPAKPGEYVFETDMVHENVAWFSETRHTVRGRFPLHISPQPQPRPRLITPARIW